MIALLRGFLDNAKSLIAAYVPRWRSSLLAGALSLLLTEGNIAQDLINTGTINNSGSFRVKDRALGLPTSIGGRFEFFGENQTVPARQYNNLVLTGSGTKTTARGSFTVSGDLMIADSVTLRVEAGSVLTLQGTLTERGYLAGRIQKEMDLSGSTSSSSFGNLGLTISWDGTAPGRTVVTRGSDSAFTGMENQSIKRYYDILPLTNSGLNATLVFRYADRELNGQNPATLVLWRSVDGGLTWRRQGGTVDVDSRTITKTGVTFFSLWTAADSDHPLGPLTIEGEAASIVHSSGNDAIGPVNTDVNPFVVTVVDAFGNPVSGATVAFEIVSVPANATGHRLTVTTMTTGAMGRAATVLTLGNKVGMYTVKARAADSWLMFNATAIAGTPTILVLSSGNSQTGTVGTTLRDPFVVTLRDSSGNAVPNAPVKFEITSTPDLAAKQSLSVTEGRTDTNGQAATMLTLGTKVGVYVVTAGAVSTSNSSVTFTATATAGTPTIIASTSGDNQSGTAGTRLSNPFIVTVRDSSGNPVPDVTVIFAIASFPSRSTGQSLSVTRTTTDVNGEASTVLTLGNKSGSCSVTATCEGLTDTPVTFTATINPKANVERLPSIPTEFELFQNYPNPFNPITRIQFAIPKESSVKLLIYDLLGRQVSTLVNQILEPGNYSALWDARDDKGLRVASGVYLYRLIAEDPYEKRQQALVLTKKLIFAR